MRSEIRISRRAIASLVTALVVGAFLAVPGPRDAVSARIAEVVDPRAVADPATLGSQRAAAERAVAVSHAKGVEQLRKVLELRLAITRAQADAIQQRALADLAAIRRTSLTAIGRATGLSGPALEAYVAEAEQRSDRGTIAGEGGVLLAPALSDLVQRTAQLSTQVTDAATRELTGAPSPSPTPSAPPRSPSPSPRSPSPSPR